MKLLLDEHLSFKLVRPLEQVFPGSAHVKQHGLETSDDDVVWQFALAGGFTILTKDEDFQILSFARGHPPKVVWLRSGNGPSSAVLDVIMRARTIIEAFGADEERSLLVLP